MEMRLLIPGFKASSIVQAGSLWDCATQSSVKTPIFSITNNPQVSHLGSCPLLTLLTQSKVPHKVVTIHDLSPPPLARLLHLHRVYHYADAVIVHSEQQKDRMLQVGIPEEKIHVVFHGGHQINLMGLVRTRVSFFGEPEEYKGFFTLLKALRILRDEGIKINLEVYGIYAEKAEQTAKKEARRNNVEDQIQWYGRLSELEFDEKMQESIFKIGRASCRERV